jgi:hypothetical protein
MRIYMAGGVSGNLKPFWKHVSAMLQQGYEYREAFDISMRVFLAGVESRHWIQEGYAGLSGGPELASFTGTKNIRGGV